MSDKPKITITLKKPCPDSEYKNGKIYIIRSPHTDKVYVGSTYKSLTQRLYKHKCHYHEYLKHSRNISTCLFLLELGEDETTIELLENYPCTSRAELHSREWFWIQKYWDHAVNKQKTGRTKREMYAEIYQRHKESYKHYHETHKEQINRRNSEKRECECGSIVTRCNFARHLKSSKHQNYLNLKV